MGVPEMDGLFHGISHLEMDDLEVPLYFMKPPHLLLQSSQDPAPRRRLPTALHAAGWQSLGNHPGWRPRSKEIIPKFGARWSGYGTMEPHLAISGEWHDPATEAPHSDFRRGMDRGEWIQRFADAAAHVLCGPTERHL